MNSACRDMVMTRQGAERRIYKFSASRQGAERDASRNLARCGVPGATRRRNEFLPRTSCPAYRTHPAFLTRRGGTREPSAGTAGRLLVAASSLSLPGGTTACPCHDEPEPRGRSNAARTRRRIR